MKPHLWLISFFVATLSGCGIQEKLSTGKVDGPFVGYVTENRFFRLNTADGKVFEYKDGKLVPVPSPSSATKLVIGELYEDENGKSLTYDGAHRFSQLSDADAIARRWGVKTSTTSK